MQYEAGQGRGPGREVRQAADGGPLAVAVASVLAAGVPGAHLSLGLSSPAGGVALGACRGAAQTFGDDGPCRRPLTVDTAHDLGSVTKVAGTTSMLVALASAGALSVDDEVGRYLPRWASLLPGVTLADLLTHRAGLWEWWPTYLTAGDPLEVVSALPLRYPPRSGRHYSDLGFMILGRVVEAVTGQRLPEAHRELVAIPAGIDGLRYAAPPAGVPVAASSRGDAIELRMVTTGVPYPVGAQHYPVAADPAAFDRWRTRVEVGEVNDGNAYHAFGGVAGHAGLFGTVDALHALGDWLLAGLAAENSLTAIRSFVEPGPDPEQALGFRRWTSTVGECAAAVVGHTGFPGIGFGIVPAHRASIVLATNRLHIDRGEPIVFEPVWLAAVDAAHAAWHAAAP